MPRRHGIPHWSVGSPSPSGPFAGAAAPAALEPKLGLILPLLALRRWQEAALLADQVEKVLELVRPGQMLALSEVFSAGAYASFAETVEPSVVIAIAVGSS